MSDLRRIDTLIAEIQGETMRRARSWFYCGKGHYLTADNCRISEKDIRLVCLDCAGKRGRKRQESALNAQPLVAYIERQRWLNDHLEKDEFFAARGIHPRAFERVKAENRITETLADKWCCAFGVRPGVDFDEMEAA